MSILPDWCQFVSSSSISACPQRVKYRPHLMGFLCFRWLTFQRYHALVCKTFLRKPHKWPSKYVGLSGALHPEFLSCHPYRVLSSLAFWNHKTVRDSNLSTQSHFGTHHQMSPGVTIACLWWKVPSSCSCFCDVPVDLEKEPWNPTGRWFSEAC